MTASVLSSRCRHAAIGLILVGLMTAQFLSLARLGMVFAILGVACYGGSLVAGYLEWERGE